MSSIGAMFAPRHRDVANELVRVCRAGGTIGLLSWTPDGMLGALFRTMGPFAPPPPPGAQPAPLWGSEEHLRELFGDRVEFRAFERDLLEITAFERPHDYREHFKALYGPTIAVRANAQRDGREGEFEKGGGSASWAEPLDRITRCARAGRRSRRTPGMPASDATVIEAGGRDLRVSSPDRVIFPPTERFPAVTKLDVVKYYLAVEDGVMRALARRPTTLERWPKGVLPGIVLSTREKGGGDAFFQKRVPRGAPDYLQTARIEFPSGRHADEICPTEVAMVGWSAQMGTITFHPWPVRSDDVDHPDELRLDLDPQPGTDFADAVRVAAEARVLLDDLGYVGFPKTSGGRGIHIYVRIEPRWTFTDVRHAAIAFGRELERRLPGQVTTKWWKEERGERIFVDYNQNARDRTIASAYSIRPKPGAPVSGPVTWDELAEVVPEDFTIATMPARFAEVGDRHAAIDDRAHSLQPLLDMYEKDTAEGEGDMPYPPDYPKMPGEPKRVQPSRDRDRPR